MFCTFSFFLPLRLGSAIIKRREYQLTDLLTDCESRIYYVVDPCLSHLCFLRFDTVHQHHMARYDQLTSSSTSMILLMNHPSFTPYLLNLCLMPLARQQVHNGQELLGGWSWGAYRVVVWFAHVFGQVANTLNTCANREWWYICIYWWKNWMIPYLNVPFGMWVLQNVATIFLYVSPRTGWDNAEVMVVRETIGGSPWQGTKPEEPPFWSVHKR